MKLLVLYIMFCTGLLGFAAGMFGQGNAFLQYGSYVLLAFSTLYCFHLFLRRKIVISNLTLLLAAYVILRIIVVMFFALFHEYNVWSYIYPLKNWIILLNLFIIGQSLPSSEETVNSIIIRTLFMTVLILLVVEIAGNFVPKLGQFYQLTSRIPFVQYRFNIDEFIVVYAYLLLSLKMIAGELSLLKYQIGIVMLILAIVISQTKQILPAFFIVSLFLIVKKTAPYLTKRKAVYAVSLFAVTGVLITVMYILIVSVPHESFFSLWRRAKELDYVTEKVAAYPVFGYPIPSNLFGWAMPKDIIYYFYGFDFKVTLFPSDLPLPFILAEEGVAGLLFVIAFLALCYRKNPLKVSYVLIVLLSLIGTFRMYHMIPVQSSFTYFMLGFLTRPVADEQL